MDNWPSGLGAGLQNLPRGFDSRIVLHAPVVKRISSNASNVKVRVRFLAGVPSHASGAGLRTCDYESQWPGSIPGRGTMLPW
jgi:hypothetical protein